MANPTKTPAAAVKEAMAKPNPAAGARTLYEGGQDKLTRLFKYFDPTQYHLIILDEDGEGDLAPSFWEDQGYEIAKDLPRGLLRRKEVLLVGPKSAKDARDAERLAGLLAEDDDPAKIDLGNDFDVTKHEVKSHPATVREVIDSLPEDTPADDEE